MPSWRSPAGGAAAPKRDLPSLISTARPFLRGELDQVDPELPNLVAVLRSVGAGECFHKHGSFLEHLTDTYRILKIWSAPDAVARCGLYHSSYSNSYVNLAIFDPGTGRDRVRSLIGPAAEHLVHLFCVVPRHSIIHDDLLFKYTSDAELAEHLARSEESVRKAMEEGVSDPEEAWRRKVREVAPPGGVTVKHIRTGEDVVVSRRVLASFLLMTMADFSDQYYGYQDVLFGNDEDGRLEFVGNNWAALWPGDGKPGLWMNAISRMGALYMLMVREEELYLEERRRRGGGSNDTDRDEDIELVVPPVFEGCTRVLDAAEQRAARDLYWAAVCSGVKDTEGLGKVEGLLKESCERNPYVGEPHLVLAQVYLGMGRWEEAEREAGRGLRMVVEWGSSWDKRMTWEGWVAWGRVLLMKATERAWPDNVWGILNLGLVK